MGDQREYEELVRWAMTDLVKLAADCGLPDGHREDVVQDALLSLHKRDDVKHPKAYLKAAVCNGSMNYWRRYHRRAEEPIDGLEDKLTLKPRQDDGWLWDAIRKALERMHPRRRALATLLYGLGFKSREIAEITDQSRSAVASACSRATRDLRRVMREIDAGKRFGRLEGPPARSASRESEETHLEAPPTGSTGGATKKPAKSKKTSAAAAKKSHLDRLQ